MNFLKVECSARLTLGSDKKPGFSKKYEREYTRKETTDFQKRTSVSRYDLASRPVLDIMVCLFQYSVTRVTRPKGRSIEKVQGSSM